MKPSPFSVVLFLAAAGLFAASRPSTAHTVIDRGFLRTLAAMPTHRDLTEAEYGLYSDLIWGNEYEIKYLAATGDPLAVRSVVRIMAIGGAPGGCCCIQHTFDDCITTAPFSIIIDAVRELGVPRQVLVLRNIDQSPWFDGDGEFWDAERDVYLRANPLVNSAYVEAVAADAREAESLAADTR